MMDEEAFHTFLSGLQPHLQEHMEAHVQGDLEVAIAMAQHLEVYHGGDGAKTRRVAKTTTKGPKKFKKQKKGNVVQVEGSSSGGDRPGGPSREETAAKEGQGQLGLRQKEGQAGRTKESTMPQLWWRPLLVGLQGVERN